jgi:MFS transporter, PPP family, 3-phenylpropionic acid transporter
MPVERRALLRFILLYVALFSAFGSSSPFLPAFLAGRGLGAGELGFVLGAATAVRLFCGPIAGRIADRFQLFRAELAVCASIAAGAALLYLLADGFWAVMAISSLQAAALAPLVPLADALSLAYARTQQRTAGFEYGWVRGVGSAAFVAGTLAAGQAAALLHLASMRLITDSVPSVLTGTAQAIYGLVGVGGATAVLIIVSGWLYSWFGAEAFWAMALLCIAALPVIWSLHRAVSERAA